MESQDLLTPDKRRLFDSILDRTAEKVAEDEARLGMRFPHFADPDWRTLPATLSAGYGPNGWNHGNWTCGFWIGILLASFLKTSDPEFEMLARERMRLVAQRADDPNTHDLGFIFDSSAVPGFRITGDPWYAAPAVQAASRLRARVITTRSGAYISSWGPLGDRRGRTSSAIDTMANLPLLYWAANYSGDASHRLVAVAHAAKTREAFVRPDQSTYHALEYDETTGEAVRGYTFQGYADNSMWARGQAWAVYGYAATARETGVLGYLDLAEQLAERYLARAGGAVVPAWDFDDPDAPDTTKDSSAAAIMASALLELGALHPDQELGRRWTRRAIDILEGLSRDYFAYEPEHRGLLKRSCYSKPHGQGTDSATMFGDFYFVEALCQLVLPGRFRPETSRMAS